MSSPRAPHFITAPSPLGLRPPAPGRVPGVRGMPHALIEAGLLEGLASCPRTDLPEPTYSPDLDPSTGVRNLTALTEYSRRLADVVAAALDLDQLPIVIGGDCSVLLGPALALRRRGRFGLVHVDAHNDFGHAGNYGSHYPSAAGADLALVTGRGPSELTHLAGPYPYFNDTDVFQIGEKEETEPGSPSCPDYLLTEIHRFPLAEVRCQGLGKVLDDVSSHLDSLPLAGFWLHLDVDVLDGALMPAVDCPEPTGFDWSEFETLLAHFSGTPGLTGINIGIYDPDLDPDRSLARELVKHLRPSLLHLAAAPVTPAHRRA